MGESSQQELKAVWQQLAQRHDWRLVADEAAFLRAVAAEFDELDDSTPLHQRARLAVLRAYGLLLYTGLQERQNQAAYEIWLACYRLALRDGWSRADAEVLAQETIARVLTSLHTLRSPQSIISWSLRICRTVRMLLSQQAQAEQPLQSDNEVEPELADVADMTADVEQRLLSQQLVDLLRAKLPNNLERFVLMRIVLFGDQPRDVARELGLPLHRTRIAKSRALQRLRDDTQMLELLGELAGTVTRQVVASGGNGDGSEDT